MTITLPTRNPLSTPDGEHRPAEAAAVGIVTGPPVAEPRIDGPERAATAAAVEAASRAVERLGLAKAVDVSPDDSWAEAGRAVLRLHLARMLARTAGAIEGVDPEEVHAMRVAGRRMRAAWRVFGDAYEPITVRRFRRDLREIGGRLGAVRDLDVLIGILETHVGRRRERERTALLPLLGAWRGERETRRLELIETLGSAAFLDFVAEYEAFVATPGMATRPVEADRPSLVRHRMPATIWTDYAAVWAFDGSFAGGEMATLHQARIAGKWLRYTLEFARAPLEPEAAGLVSRIVAVQDHLGDLHDLHVAAELARALAADPTVELSRSQQAAIGRFVGHLDHRVERLRATAGPTWREVTGASYRRSLGRALARL
jgi:CHAD domain-containing protein